MLLLDKEADQAELQKPKFRVILRLSTLSAHSLAFRLHLCSVRLFVVLMQSRFCRLLSILASNALEVFCVLGLYRWTKRYFAAEIRALELDGGSSDGRRKGVTTGRIPMRIIISMKRYKMSVTQWSPKSHFPCASVFVAAAAGRRNHSNSELWKVHEKEFSQFVQLSFQYTQRFQIGFSAIFSELLVHKRTTQRLHNRRFTGIQMRWLADRARSPGTLRSSTFYAKFKLEVDTRAGCLHSVPECICWTQNRNLNDKGQRNKETNYKEYLPRNIVRSVLFCALFILFSVLFRSP